MRVEPRAAAAICTVLLHLLAGLALMVASAVGDTPAPAPDVRALTATKLYGAGEQVIGVDISPGLSTDGLPCTGSSYIGVGVTADPRSERIVLVGDNTPASRAGLQPDDIVLNPAVWRDARREGALLRLLVLRHGVTMVLSVWVGKICIG